MQPWRWWWLTAVGSRDSKNIQPISVCGHTRKHRLNFFLTKQGDIALMKNRQNFPTRQPKQQNLWIHQKTQRQNFPTKQAYTPSSRNRQTKLSSKTNKTFLGKPNFPAIITRWVGDISLYALEGRILGSYQIPSTSQIGNPTKQNQSVTHQEASIDACFVSQHGCGLR